VKEDAEEASQPADYGMRVEGVGGKLDGRFADYAVNNSGKKFLITKFLLITSDTEKCNRSCIQD
jgi:hypothetical protein